MLGRRDFAFRDRDQQASARPTPVERVIVLPTSQIALQRSPDQGFGESPKSGQLAVGDRMVSTMIKIPTGTHGIVYVRVSTAHQAEDELPVDSQVAELTAAVAAAGATCEVVKDAGISGTDFEHRPGLQEIVARAREPRPNFTWVLVWKLSRF